MPRILGLLVLRKIGIDCCEALPVLAFAVPANSKNILVPVYSDRLMRNFATRGYRTDLAAATKPLTIISGTDDELMFADKYAEAVHGSKLPVDVRLIDGINHMGNRQRAEGGLHRRRRRRDARRAGILSGSSTMMIDSKQASDALNDINDIARQVRQSTIYILASLMLIMWGVLVFGGYLVSYLSPRHAGYAWLTVYVAGIAGMAVISGIDKARSGIRTLDVQDVGGLPAVHRVRPSSPASGSVISRRVRWGRFGRSIACWSIPSPGCGSGGPSSRSALASSCSR